MNQAAKKDLSVPQVNISAGVVRSIRQHARTSMKTEVCGVLIGTEDGGKVIVTACIQGVNAAQGGAHVTFTQETWEHIYQIKDREHPDDRIVGWYHSHPSFGIFLSDHDLFIHRNFFSSPLQIAWVYDPASDEEGCFGWVRGEIERITRITLRDGEEDRAFVASSNDEPAEEQDWSLEVKTHKEKKISAWVHWLNYAVTHLLAVALGIGATLYMLTANVGRAFDEGYVTAIKDVAHGSFRVPASMTVKEFLQKTGIDPDRLRSSDPMVLPRTSQPSTPGNKP